MLIRRRPPRTGAHERGIFEVPDDGQARCSKCGGLGHNRSSRLCPFFTVQEEVDGASRDGTPSRIAC